jgi:hypothetical protein
MQRWLSTTPGLALTLLMCMALCAVALLLLGSSVKMALGAAVLLGSIFWLPIGDALINGPRKAS